MASDVLGSAIEHMQLAQAEGVGQSGGGMVWVVKPDRAVKKLQVTPDNVGKERTDKKDAPTAPSVRKGKRVDGEAVRKLTIQVPD